MSIKNITMVQEGAVSFIISEDNVLLKMANEGNQKDIVIPDKFDTGEKIEAIGFQCCIGEFGCVEISDKIEKIHAGAFERAKVKSVKWSKGCKTIPCSCFHDSTLEIIDCIGDVEQIQAGAFESCSVREIVWPSKCKEIPASCFFNSEITVISNIDHVKKIGDNAFAKTPMAELEWPSECDTVPAHCFCYSNIQTIYNAQAIDYYSESAFENCGDVKKIMEKKDGGNVEVECTLPCWLSKAAEKENINLSEILIETLKAKINQ